MAKSKTDKKFLRSTVAWAMLAGLAGTAYAQDEQQPAEPSDQAQEQSEDEAIVVTGSRLRTNEFTSASPVQVITTERGALTGVSDAGELLQSSTLAAGSPQNDATISSAFVTEGGPGSQTISLRGLGANRTLVLVNGRRGGPAGTRGQVSAFDLNVVPLAAVERFEILKDGASSVYGSDAVAGVVNIITTRDLDGGSVELFASQPFEEGGAEYSFEGIWGTTFDRGFFSASFDYYLQQELTFGDREFTACRQDYTFDAASGDRDDRIDARTNRPACRDVLSGQVWLYEYSYSGGFAPGQYLDSPGGGVLVQYDPSGQIGSLFPQTIFPAQVDGSNPTAPSDFVGINQADRATAGVTNANPPQLRDASLVPEIERFTVFLQGGYDLSANVEAYAEVLLNRRRSATNGVRQFWTYLFTYDYFYQDGLPGGGDPFSAGWNGAAILSPTPITDHFDAEQTVDYTRVVAGLRGSFGGPLGAVDWDIFVQGSRSDAEYSQDVILDDAVRSAQLRNDFGLNFGNSITRPGASCVGFNTPISNRPCIDINWLGGNFLNGFLTPQEEAFLFDTETGNTRYDQVYAEGTLAGDVFAMPAGNLGAVIGFHVRRDEIEDVPGDVTLAGNSWGLSSSGITAGDDTTSEVFGELRVPIFRGAPFAEEVTLNVSGRFTDVESYGDDFTHKIGLNWQLTPEWRVRATQGTSFRAPALFEQFLEDQTSFLGQRAIDPCINWAAQLAAGNISQRIADNCAADGIPGNYNGSGASATIVTGGGDVRAETSDAWTVGLIWTPTFIDLNVAIDYYEIEVNDEVTRLGAANIMFGCYNSVNFATEPLCDLFTRGQTASPFLVNTVTDRYINVATQINRGIDLTTSYHHELPFGDFTFQSQFTWQLEDLIGLVQGITQDNNGRVGDPQWVGNIDLRLDMEDWTYFWGIDMVGEASDDQFANNSNTAGTRLYKIDTEFTAYHSASITRRFDQWDVRVGVRNIFDEQPPALTSELFSGGSSTAGVSSLQSQYDYIGRRFFISVGRQF